MVDISQIERLLTQTGLGLSSVFEIFPDMVFVVDRDETVLFVNAVAARASDERRRIWSGASRAIFFSPPWPPATARPFSTSSAPARPSSPRTSRICTFDRLGSTRAWFRFAIRRAIIAAVVGIVRDVSERRQAQEDPGPA